MAVAGGVEGWRAYRPDNARSPASSPAGSPVVAPLPVAAPPSEAREAALPSGTCRLNVATEPRGAEVWRNGVRIGATPVEFVAVCGEPFRLELKLQGYRAFDDEIVVHSQDSSFTHKFDHGVSGQKK